MKLNNAGLQNKEEWDKAGIAIPLFDREKVKENTGKEPIWLHFGAGNIFRAFPALSQQRLLERGESDKGIIACFTMEPEVIDALWIPNDCLSLLVTLKSNGQTEKIVVGSVTEALYADKSGDWDRVTSMFENPSLQMVSFTITEKGYADITDNGAMGKLTKLCYSRYKAGAYPISLVSMDNCSHNGETLYKSIRAIADRWVAEGTLEPGFLEYIADPGKVGFPWSMIDKITPRPDPTVAKMLEECGFENAETVVTETGTYASSFVNAEEAQYLIIEDIFPNGRPPLEKAGILFTDRDTVNLVEKMKVCTCLNPLHTALAIFGCLLSFETVSEEMKDEDLVKLVNILGFKEGMPVVADPKIIDPKEFLKEVLEVRLPNPFMPDAPARIATDTSQKLPIRFGETIKAYIKHPELDVNDLEIIPLVFAAWCRYLIGTNDKGEELTLSPDPLLEQLREYMKSVVTPQDVKNLPLLRRVDIFGIDLYDTPLGAKTEKYLAKMLTGPGSVRTTLREIIA